jgi:N-acetylmuramoyl-L-alanine amidase-like
MALDSTISRRQILQIIAGGTAFAAGVPSFAADARIGRLIGEARALPTIAQRIDYISRALLDTPYRGYTLIGGPRSPEKFVMRDDAFDCVTFCETVLAGAIARDLGEFEQVLRAIRYHNGVVEWRERNHYFFEWGQHNVENKTCAWVAMDGSVTIEKTVYWHKELGKRRFSMAVIPVATFLAKKRQLTNGDIVGFVTRRPNLDYFHVGFVAFASNGDLMLRHASESRYRVLEERMDRFAAFTRVRHVTVLRPLEPAAGAVAVKKDG